MFIWPSEQIHIEWMHLKRIGWRWYSCLYHFTLSVIVKEDNHTDFAIFVPDTGLQT